MKIKLYKTLRNERRLVDFGVMTKINEYEAMGYEAVICEEDDNQALYHVKKAEFDALWYTMPAEEKRRLADIPMDWEMSIEEKVSIVKAEIACRKKRSITVVHKPARKKVSIFGTLYGIAKDFFESITPQPEVCYA